MIDICIAEITSFLPESFSEETLFVRGCREIDSVRLAKVEACKSGENKARSLCCGLMLQYYLRRHLGVEKKVEILYGYGESGKPYLKEYSDIHFNLSHSGRYAAAVFADREVGIDIQTVRSVREGLASRILSPEEHARYGQLVLPEERTEWFFRCWCAKESYGKLTGEGMAADFRHITYVPEERHISFVGTCEKARDVSDKVKKSMVVTETAKGAIPVWKAACMEYVPAPGYGMNVCVARTDEGILFPGGVRDVTEELQRLCIPV
jgi:4'-phosphopantetheinyl transferase